MDTLDYFSQPDDPNSHYYTIHVAVVPDSFRVTHTLMRLSGLSRTVLKSVFCNAPKSFRVPLQKGQRLRGYLERCGCEFTVSWDSPTHASYAAASDRNCNSLAPLWQELAFDG